MEPAVVYSKPTVFRDGDVMIPPSRTTRDFDARWFRLATIFFESRKALARHLI